MNHQFSSDNKRRQEHKATNINLNREKWLGYWSLKYDNFMNIK